MIEPFIRNEKKIVIRLFFMLSTCFFISTSFFQGLCTGFECGFIRQLLEKKRKILKKLKQEFIENIRVRIDCLSLFDLLQLQLHPN